MLLNNQLKIAYFQQKIAYFAAELYSFEISDKKSLILNRTTEMIVNKELVYNFKRSRVVPPINLHVKNHSAQPGICLAKFLHTISATMLQDQKNQFK